VRDSRGEFGRELANLRGGKGVSLEDLASAIKVRLGLLKALEEGRFEALPPPIFVEGYLKAYAHHLGVEAAPLLALYRGLSQASAPPPKVHAAPAPLLDEEGRRSGWLKWVLLVVVLAAAGYGAFQLVGRMQPVESADAPLHRSAPPREPATLAPVQGDAPATPPETPPPQQPPAGEPVPQLGQSGGEAGPSVSIPTEPAAAPPAAAPEPAAPQPLPPANTAAVTAPAQTPPATPVGDLVLTATGPCWCEVWADGRRVLYRMVAAGESVGFRGSSFKASMGNAGAVGLVYKGQRVPLPREQGIVVRDLAIPGQSGGSEP
jgi:cytoskeleton protein RodZ